MSVDCVLLIASHQTVEATLETCLPMLQARHKGAKFILLVTPHLATQLRNAGMELEIWPDAQLRGILRFIALMRRISWAGAKHIYDLDQTVRTRLMRFLVWPRPHWHSYIEDGLS
jgi:hypothetical protein